MLTGDLHVKHRGLTDTSNAPARHPMIVFGGALVFADCHVTDPDTGGARTDGGPGGRIVLAPAATDAPDRFCGISPRRQVIEYAGDAVHFYVEGQYLLPVGGLDPTDLMSEVFVDLPAPPARGSDDPRDLVPGRLVVGAWPQRVGLIVGLDEGSAWVLLGGVRAY